MTGGLIDRRELAIRMAAPYLAVLVFWCFFHSAWLTLLAYHAQILWWSRGSFPRLAIPRRTSMLLLVLPSAFAGPLMYFLLPLATRVDLSSWLADHHLTGLALAVMVPYYGLVHPILEQVYWTPLRESTPLAHLAFASYHMLVLGSLLTIPWLIVRWSCSLRHPSCGSEWRPRASFLRSRHTRLRTLASWWPPG
jgi:hypothetical protein